MSHLTFKRRGNVTVALRTYLNGEERIEATYHDDCAHCQLELKEERTFFPPHEASKGCKSGKRAHCSCRACF